MISRVVPPCTGVDLEPTPIFSEDGYRAEWLAEDKREWDREIRRYNTWGTAILAALLAMAGAFGWMCWTVTKNNWSNH